jgi:hypothetical protein
MKDPDVIISDEICRFCKEKGYGKEELLAALVRLSIITLTTLDSTELSGEVAGYELIMHLNNTNK